MNKATMRILASCTFVLFLLSFTSVTHAQNPLIGDNIVFNGDFSLGDSLWVVEGDRGTVTHDGTLYFDLTSAGNPWELQSYQVLTADQIGELSKGGNWELTFDARTTVDSSKTFHVFLGHNGGGWERYWASDGGAGDGDVTVDGTMQSYKLTTNITETWDAMKLGFEVAADSQDLWIDNVVLRRVEDNLLYDGQLVIGADSMSAAWNRVADGQFATYSADNGEIKIAELANFQNIFDVQFIQELDTAQVDSIYSGPYEMFFDARTSGPEKEIQVFFGNNGTGGDWTNWAPRVTLNDTMKTYKLNITADGNWPQMKIGFEVSSDTTSVWFDNVIVRRVRDIPPAAPVVNLTTKDGIVTIAVDPVADAFTYEVYFADSAFTTIEGGSNVGTIDASGTLSLTHTTMAPHPDLVSNFTAHYGVIAKKENGTASMLTAGSIATDMSVRPNYIVELADADANSILGAVAGNNMPDAATIAGYFPDDYMPFTINEETRTIENGSGGDSDADISGKLWAGYETSNPAKFFIFYAEITDDIFVGAPSTGENPAGGAWNFDSWEGGIGAYEPGSFINGSDHLDFELGDEPDYQLRAGIYDDDTGFILAYSGAGNTLNQEVPNSATIFEKTDTGYRLLTIMSTIELTGIETTNDDFVFPTGDAFTTVPFQFTINDNDDAARDTQVGWSSKGGQDDWWNTPARWETVAMVGLDAVYSTVSNEEELGNPFTFSLEQNYPNPFNPSTKIEFTLASSSNVTLEVFNMLGQRVATLVGGQKLSAGKHNVNFDASSLASGMYVYRISAANFVQTRKMMLIK